MGTEDDGQLNAGTRVRVYVDGFLERSAYDAAVVVSNDSDLAMPVELVRAHGLPLGVLNPHRRPTPQLWPRTIQQPHFGRRIEVADLIACQLPDPVTDRNGVLVVSSRGNPITKPPTW